MTFAGASGATFLTVKTLGPAHHSPEYAHTRAFYHRLGFVPLEEFADFWGKDVPMLLMRRTVAP